MKTTKLTLEIPTAVTDELTYLVELQQQYGAPNPQKSMESLLVYMAAVIADGSRRPGSWERQLLEMTGLAPDALETSCYRSHFGRPPSPEE